MDIWLQQAWKGKFQKLIRQLVDLSWWSTKRRSLCLKEPMSLKGERNMVLCSRLLTLTVYHVLLKHPTRAKCYQKCRIQNGERYIHGVRKVFQKRRKATMLLLLLRWFKQPRERRKAPWSVMPFSLVSIVQHFLNLVKILAIRWLRVDMKCSNLCFKS